MLHPFKQNTAPTNDQKAIEFEKLQVVMEEFLLQADINRNSKKTYAKGLKKFFAWLAATQKKNQIERKTIIEYKNYLAEINLRPHTQAIYFGALKQFFKWTESTLIFPNIAFNIKGIKKLSKQHHKDPLTKEEVNKLLTSLSEKKTIKYLRDKALISLLIFTGLRIGEAANIQLKDIEKISSEKHIIWIKGKGRIGKDNFIILIEEAWNAIREYLEERVINEALEEESFLFRQHNKKKITIKTKLHVDSVARIVNEHLKKTKIKNEHISPHSLRHTFGTSAIEAGVSLHDLQLAMRHTSSTTTQVYLGDIEKKRRKEASSEKKVRDFLLNKG